MSSAAGAPESSSASATKTPAFARSYSVRSSKRLPPATTTQGEGYAADNDDDEEGDVEGDDGDDDDEDVTAGEGAFGGQELLDETTIRSGYLWKRGEKRKNWKKRWFALRSSKLCYYKNEKEYQLLRFIDIADVHTVAAIALKKNEHSFGIVTSKRQYYVRAANATEMQQWIDALNEAREQLQQRSTITREMAGMEMGASGGEDVGSPRKRGSSVNTALPSMDRQHSIKVNTSSSVSPINIVIPGKGLYTSPAQARQNSTGASITSPLTATSDSENGTVAGAEQFGLSYASSAGHSLASSPGRGGFIHHQLEQNNTGGGAGLGGRQSPQNHSGGDEAYESLRRSKTNKKSSSGMRDTSAGSSGGEGSGMRTGWTAAGGKAPVSQTKDQQQAAVLSSSDEDGEGEDWDEDEVADLAMPLPSSTGIASTHSGGQMTPQWATSASSTPLASGAKPKVDSDFFKNTSKVIHQGYLMKQSNRRKHWRKRYFVLTSVNLSYTRSHMNEKPSRQIPLTSILDAIEYTSKKIQMPTNQTQSTPLSSPGIQSPPMPITFQLGSNNQDVASAAPPASSKESTSAPGDAATHEQTIERKTSVIGHASALTKKKQENCFKIITPKRTYVVCAPTEEEEIKWLSALQALLAHWRSVKGAGPDTTTNATSGPQQPSGSATNAPPSKPIRRGSASEDVKSTIN